MTVSVEMIAGGKDSAVILPAELIRGADGDAPYVLALRDGRAVQVPVTLGLRGVGSVEVSSGVADGDLVIGPASAAVAGDRVSPRGKPGAKGNMQPVPGFTN
jgi:HlyD family secretion protein